ncbi:hypothetical protein [Streptomyces mangrovi]|uniref:hypothetical protein n=1 Tax=Streptomyces mangrovi TaxID=1206892 RepID=UPI00399C5C1B
METSELAELRTMFIFTPPQGSTWNLVLEDFAARLRERTPDEFVRIDENPQGPGARGPSMSFGFTLQDGAVEGFVLTTPEGAAVTNVTAQEAAEFAMWLRNHVVPNGAPMMVNTEWGVEDDVPEALVPDVPRPSLVAALLSHLEETLD